MEKDRDLDKELEEAEEIIKDVFEQSIGDLFGPLAQIKYRQMRGKLSIPPNSFKKKKKKKEPKPTNLKVSIGDILKAKENKDESNG